MRKRIVGLDDVVEQVLIAIFTRQHVLLEGVPGLAKTLLLSTVADLLDLSFSRVQFTPDLMPSDVTGSEYLVQDPQTGERAFRFAAGPIFANVILADEINRAPPKTQAALMEAMEEGQVTSLGVSRPLDDPFFVLATQNPIEQEGTYPLPAAQLDRFLFKVRLDYPTREEEGRIARLTVRGVEPALDPLLKKDDLLRLQQVVVETPVPDAIVRYAVRIAQASRPMTPHAPPRVREYVEWGAGPRAAQALVMAARARALLQGRPVPDAEDVGAVAAGVMRHRMILSYAAEADDLDADDLVGRILEHVRRPGAPERRESPLWSRLLALMGFRRAG
jgi:MoxR-like ATPase